MYKNGYSKHAIPLAATLDPTVSPIPVLTPATVPSPTSDFAITAFPIQIPTGTRSIVSYKTCLSIFKLF